MAKEYRRSLLEEWLSRFPFTEPEVKLKVVRLQECMDGGNTYNVLSDILTYSMLERAYLEGKVGADLSNEYGTMMHANAHEWLDAVQQLVNDNFKQHGAEQGFAGKMTYKRHTVNELLGMISRHYNNSSAGEWDVAPDL